MSCGIQQTVDSTERTQVQVQGDVDYPKYLIVTGRSLESALSNRCINVQDPGSQEQETKAQLRVCHKSHVVRADIWRPDHLGS